MKHPFETCEECPIFKAGNCDRSYYERTACYEEGVLEIPKQR